MTKYCCPDCEETFDLQFLFILDQKETFHITCPFCHQSYVIEFKGDYNKDPHFSQYHKRFNKLKKKEREENETKM